MSPKNTKYHLPCTPQNPARAGAGGSDKASLHHGDILPGEQYSTVQYSTVQYSTVQLTSPR